MTRLAAIVLLLFAVPAAAAPTENPSLYRAVTIVTGTGEQTRPRGFAECLVAVLVKVAGDPGLAADPAVAALAGRAGSMVRAFSYRDRMAGIPVHDEQGTRDRPHFLTVDFDPAAIDQALRVVGRQPWPEPRPPIGVRLRVETGDRGFAVTGDGTVGRNQREALHDAAERFGLPLVLPDRAAGGTGTTVELAGTLVWDDAAGGWTSQWHLRALEHDDRWTEAGVSFDQVFRAVLGRTALALSGNAR